MRGHVGRVKNVLSHIIVIMQGSSTHMSPFGIGHLVAMSFFYKFFLSPMDDGNEIVDDFLETSNAYIPIHSSYMVVIGFVSIRIDSNQYDQ